MRNLIHKRNKGRLPSPQKLKLIPENEKNTNLNKMIHLIPAKNPISLNIKNIIQLNEENKSPTRRVNSFDNTHSKNQSMLLRTFHNKNLILRNNNMFKTNDSNSDNSYSSTYNSTAKTKIFSEQNVRKYLLKTEDNININYNTKFVSRNYTKNSTLGNIINSYTFNNEKKVFPKIKRLTTKHKNNFSFFSNLTERDSFINNSKVDTYHLSRNKDSSPVKLLSNSSLINNSNSPKIYSFKGYFLNKRKFNLNYSRPKTPKQKKNPLIKNIDIIRKVKKKKLTSNLNNNKIRNYFKKNDFLFKSENNGFQKIKSFNEKIRKNIDSKEKKYNFSDNEIIMSKLPKRKKIKKELTKRKSVSTLRVSKNYQLPKITEILNSKANDNEEALKTSKKTLKIKKEKSIKKINIFDNDNKTFNLFFNTYNTCTETDSENSSESSIESKKNIRNSSLLDGNNIKAYFKSPKKIKERIDLTIKHNHKKKNKFERDIIDQLDNIEKNSLQSHFNIIHLFQNNKFHLFCQYEKNIKILEENYNKKNKTKVNLMKSFIIDKKLKYNTLRYEKRYLKGMLKLKNKYKPMNKSFLNSYLLDRYFIVKIFQEIYYNNYLEFPIRKTNHPNFIHNFTKGHPLLRIASINKKKSSLCDIKYTSFNIFPKKDYMYICQLYILDYEYHIKAKIKPIKFEFEKLRVQKKWYYNNILNMNLDNKRKKTRFYEHSTFKSLIKNPNKFNLNENNKEEEKDKEIIKEKHYLKNALAKINFYYKKGKKSNKKRKNYAKSMSKTLREKQLEKRKSIINEGGVNNLQMISRVTDVKIKMLKKLALSETICFHIKDRNYPQFKQLFEKYKLNPDIVDSDGNSLLSLAVQSNSFQIVNYLLNVGATVNTENNNNNTPLHFALSFHNYEIADMLIQRGADEKVLNRYGLTPWQCLDNGTSIY